MSSDDENPKSQIDRTEHHQVARSVVDKMHDPKTIHAKQMHTNISKGLLPNTLLLASGVDGLMNLTEGDISIFYVDNRGRKRVAIMREDETASGDVPNLVPWRDISFEAYRDNKYWGEKFWSPLTGNLMEQMMSLPVRQGEGGWRSEQGEREISSLTNSERQLLAAQKEQQPGYVKRVLNAVAGRK